MKSLIGTTSRSLAIVITLNLLMIPFGFLVWADPQDIANKLLSIARPGRDAIQFKVWTNGQKGQSFYPGDKAVIYLKAERQAYISLLSISSEGTVSVILPNKVVMRTLIEPNRTYALFGENFPLTLTAGKTSEYEKLLVYLSSVPLDPDPLIIPNHSAWLTLTGGAGKELEILKEKIRTLAEKEGFNFAVVSLKSDTGKDLEIKLTEAPRSSSYKKLPGRPESTIPETITGSAGLKPLPED